MSFRGGPYFWSLTVGSSQGHGSPAELSTPNSLNPTASSFAWKFWGKSHEIPKKGYCNKVIFNISSANLNINFQGGPFFCFEGGVTNNQPFRRRWKPKMRPHVLARSHRRFVDTTWISWTGGRNLAKPVDMEKFSQKFFGTRLSYRSTG